MTPKLIEWVSGRIKRRNDWLTVFGLLTKKNRVLISFLCIIASVREKHPSSSTWVIDCEVYTSRAPCRAWKFEQRYIVLYIICAKTINNVFERVHRIQHTPETHSSPTRNTDTILLSKNINPKTSPNSKVCRAFGQHLPNSKVIWKTLGKLRLKDMCYCNFLRRTLRHISDGWRAE